MLGYNGRRLCQRWKVEAGIGATQQVSGRQRENEAAAGNHEREEITRQAKKSMPRRSTISRDGT